MFSILLYDTDDFFSKSEVSIITKAGYTVRHVRSDFEALDILKKYPIDLCIIDTDIHKIPGNGFLFLKQLRNNFSSLPVIFTTEGNIDNYIGYMLRYDIGNVLLKPVTSDSLITIIRKVITGNNIFGLQNCIKELKDIRKIKIVDSNQIKPAIDKILNDATSWNFTSIDHDTIRILLQEMMINALYHSYGKTKEKLERKRIILSGGDFIETVYGHNDEKFGAAIIDYNGSLTRQTILKTLFDVVEQEKMMQSAIESSGHIENINLSESGRGIDLLRKLSGEYYFNIRRKYMTEIIFIFDINFHKDDTRSSLNIFEVD